MAIQIAGMDIDPQELSFIVDRIANNGNEKWYSHFRKQFAVFL